MIEYSYKQPTSNNLGVKRNGYICVLSDSSEKINLFLRGTSALDDKCRNALLRHKLMLDLITRFSRSLGSL